MPETNKSLVRALVEAINTRDWPAILNLVASDFKQHSAAAGEPGVRSAAQLVAFLQAELVTFPDATENLLDVVAEGDKVAARHRFRGTQLGPLGNYPPSGRVLDASYLAIYRVENHQIAGAWAEWDNLPILHQLRHRPPV